MVYESDIESHLVREVRKRKGKCIKLHTLSEEGLPDRMVLLPGGRVIFVELKRIGGVLSPMQIMQHKKFKRLGHEVQLAWCKEDVDRILEEEVWT